MTIFLLCILYLFSCGIFNMEYIWFFKSFVYLSLCIDSYSTYISADIFNAILYALSILIWLYKSFFSFLCFFLSRIAPGRSINSILSQFVFHWAKTMPCGFAQKRIEQIFLAGYIIAVIIVNRAKIKRIPGWLKFSGKSLIISQDRAYVIRL